MIFVIIGGLNMKTINQDILNLPTPDKDEINLILHQTNCLGVAGGLAGAIFKKYPEAFEVYKKEFRLGNFSRWTNENDNLSIVNLNGQQNIGGAATNYNALAFALGMLATQIEIEWISGMYYAYNIYIPYKIGCGLGGGDWNKVQEILNMFEVNLSKICKVYLCKPDWIKK